MEIQFLNHAAVKITTEDAVILTDPWFKGSSFNDGWDLLFQPPQIEAAALAEITHVWISHEHPDHFSIPFFLSFPEDLKKRVEILFQDTRDKRVCGFLRARGFSVRELKHHEPYRVGAATELCIGKSAFYDSYLHLKNGGVSLLNLNDCPMAETAVLQRIRARFGAPTVLLSQFSYAAWKGGKSNRSMRTQMAARKIECLKNQTLHLGAGHVIPFASFIYFSNEENAYMNDSINTIDSVFAGLGDLNSRLVVLKPAQRWTAGTTHDNADSRLFWREKFAAVSSLPLRKPGAAVAESVLREAFEGYKARVLSKNSGALIHFIRRLPGLNAFRPINLRLSDLGGGAGETYRLDFNTGLSRAPGEPHDVEMHSSSLLFIFKNEFGYDTLTVNARFEASAAGFSKMTKFLAVGSLNTLGLSLSFGFLFRHLAVVWSLLKLLRSVKKNLELEL